VSQAKKDVDKLIIDQEIKQFMDRKSKYTDNKHKAYALILSQCTIRLKNKLESRRD